MVHSSKQLISTRFLPKVLNTFFCVHQTFLDIILGYQKCGFKVVFPPNYYDLYSGPWPNVISKQITLSNKTIYNQNYFGSKLKKNIKKI